MAIAYEKNTNLAFDTLVLKKAARQYKQVANDLRDMASKLDTLLLQLQEDKTGWSTPAGESFYDMTKTNWGKNIEKYASLLDTLNDILIKAADEYDELVIDHIHKTKVNID